MDVAVNFRVPEKIIKTRTITIVIVLLLAACSTGDNISSLQEADSKLIEELRDQGLPPELEEEYIEYLTKRDSFLESFVDDLAQATGNYGLTLEDIQSNDPSEILTPKQFSRGTKWEVGLLSLSLYPGDTEEEFYAGLWIRATNLSDVQRQIRGLGVTLTVDGESLEGSVIPGNAIIPDEEFSRPSNSDSCVYKKWLQPGETIDFRVCYNTLGYTPLDLDRIQILHDIPSEGATWVSLELPPVFDRIESTGQVAELIAEGQELTGRILEFLATQ